MLTNYKENNIEGMKVFANKEPVWSDGLNKKYLIFTFLRGASICT